MTIFVTACRLSMQHLQNQNHCMYVVGMENLYNIIVVNIKI